MKEVQGGGDPEDGPEDDNFYTIQGASIKTEIKLPHMNDNRNFCYIYKYIILYLLMIY